LQAYYSSGGDDEVTLRDNMSAFHRIWLRPRVLRDVSAIDTSTTILGYTTPEGVTPSRLRMRTAPAANTAAQHSIPKSPVN
jgi:isopentenyl diphosphate isomerase/L-lactate dehydrogenase-like FMN-dependent dehydrogenase